MSSFHYHHPVKISFMPYQEAFKQIQASPLTLITSEGFHSRPVFKDLQNILGHYIHQTFNAPPNPELTFMQQLKKELKHSNGILALGGGSVLDCAKFLSIQGEITAQNASLHIDPSSSFIPIYAFPTTAGTSSELTSWATLWDSPNNLKYSLVHESLYPREAFYDPSLMLTLPSDITIHTALDTLSHAIESIWNKKANPITIHHATHAIDLILQHLLALTKDLQSLELRQQIMLASVHAGLAFSNTQTALAHALSYPITMRFKIPHGLACSFTLPLLLDVLEDERANAILKPYKQPIKQLFENLNISTRLSDYSLDHAMIKQMFANLNERAKNGVFILEDVKEYFLKNL